MIINIDLVPNLAHLRLADPLSKGGIHLKILNFNIALVLVRLVMLIVWLRSARFIDGGLDRLVRSDNLF